jgi:SAM-dependent methyltransferase
VTGEFGEPYADLYDAVYGDKPYGAECELIERLLLAHGEHGGRRLLDLGCGTGGHAIPLARRGWQVTGVDRAPEMLARAGAKLAERPEVRLELIEGDVRTVDLGREFDAALMMFAVLGYQTGNRDVAAALSVVRRHLRTGGLFVFDVWYGPAVLAQRPTARFRVVPVADGRVLRQADGELDVPRHLCTVHFHLWRLRGERVIAETEERHTMRFFFPLELEAFLAGADLELVRLGAFPDFDRDPDETTWNVLGVARAR